MIKSMRFVALIALAFSTFSGLAYAQKGTNTRTASTNLNIQVNDTSTTSEALHVELNSFITKSDTATTSEALPSATVTRARAVTNRLRFQASGLNSVISRPQASQEQYDRFLWRFIRSNAPCAPIDCARARCLNRPSSGSRT